MNESIQFVEGLLQQEIEKGLEEKVKTLVEDFTQDIEEKVYEGLTQQLEERNNLRSKFLDQWMQRFVEDFQRTMAEFVKILCRSIEGKIEEHNTILISLDKMKEEAIRLEKKISSSLKEVNEIMESP